MNYSIRIRQNIIATKEEDIRVGDSLEDSKVEIMPSLAKELDENYTIPKRMINRTILGDTKSEDEVESKFHVLVEQETKDKDNLEKLLTMLEEKLKEVTWYEIHLQVNHEDEGVMVSNSEWRIVKSKGTPPLEEK